MTSERLARVTAFALAALAAGCADLERGPAAPTVDAGTGEGGAVNPDGGVTFAAVEPILIGSCQRCHSSGGEAGDTAFLLTGDAAADHTAATAFVNPGAPASSRLLTKMAGNGHGGGTVFGAATPEYQTVLSWIQEGAPQ